MSIDFENIKWGNIGWNLLTYAITFIMFFPILWMVLTSFKLESVAFSLPPRIIFEPTLQNWDIAILQSPFLDRLWNTLIVTLFSTFAVLLLAVPAAYNLAFYPGKRSQFTMVWMVSTRMLPPAGIIVPLYIFARDLNLLDTHPGLIIIYTAMNLPLAVWLMRSFFLNIPYEVLEAARIDGANLFQEFTRIALPMVLPGLGATALLSLIFAWNEFFFAFNLTTSDAAPLSVYISSFKTAEGLFWAKLSAAATVTVLPVVLAGWLAQRQLMRGLMAGAGK